MGDSRPGRAGARAHRKDDRVGLLQRSQRRLLEPDLSGSERARSTGSDLAVPGDVRRLLVDNHIFQAVLILVMGLGFFGWAGTLFLSATRLIFSAAFRRCLPFLAANLP